MLNLINLKKVFAYKLYLVFYKSYDSILKQFSSVHKHFLICSNQISDVANMSVGIKMFCHSKFVLSEWSCVGIIIIVISR